MKIGIISDSLLLDFPAAVKRAASLGASGKAFEEYMSREQLEKSIERTRRLMKEAADKMEFIEAAQYRDEMMKLQELLDGKK